MVCKLAQQQELKIKKMASIVRQKLANVLVSTFVKSKYCSNALGFKPKYIAVFRNALGYTSKYFTNVLKVLGYKYKYLHYLLASNS